MDTFMFKLGSLLKESWPWGRNAYYRQQAEWAGNRAKQREGEFQRDFGVSSEQSLAGARPTNPNWQANAQRGIAARGPGATAVAGKSPAALGAQLASAPAARPPAAPSAAPAARPAVASAGPRPQATPAVKPPPLMQGGGRMQRPDGSWMSMAPSARPAPVRAMAKPSAPAAPPPPVQMAKTPAPKFTAPKLSLRMG
jgi:hypothetical protein